MQCLLLCTERAEKANTPLLYQVIPLIDLVTETMEDAVNDLSLFPVVRAAAANCRELMNKYYAKTDETYMPRLAMSAFHPRYPVTTVNQLCCSASSEIQNGVLHQAAMGTLMDRRGKIYPARRLAQVL